MNAAALTDPSRANTQRHSEPGASAAPALRLALDGSDSPERQALQDCIAGRFEYQYSAHLSHFLPFLLSLASDAKPAAVVGLRPAAGDGLFVERYLDVPVERAISAVVRGPVLRDQIVEIGNLVSLEAGSSYLLFALLASMLRKAGFRWIACTATVQVESLLRGMGFEPHVVCAADAARLGDEADDWGNYYATRPQVITGDLEVAAALVAAHPTMSAIVAALEPQVTDLAADLARQIGAARSDTAAHCAR